MPLKKIPGARSSPRIPFEKLSNLPKPQFSFIDLGITKDVGNSQLEVPSLAELRKVGFFKCDQSTQTDESDIVELKSVTGTIEALLADIAQLRKDLSFAKHMLKRNYECKLDERAAELHGHANKRIIELERVHAEKIDIIRKSYRSQLSNAISKIAGEYKEYYDQLMRGKTGRHDARIRELKQRVEFLEKCLEKSEGETSHLKETLELAAKKSPKVSPAHLPETELSAEKEQQLQTNIEILERELDQANTELAAKEDTLSSYRRQSEKLSRQLDEAKLQVSTLKEEMDCLKRRSMADLEKAERLAHSQRELLEREMSERMASVERDALARASEIAEMQRAKDIARFQQQMDQRKVMEEQLRRQAAEASSRSAVPVGGTEAELSREVEKLRKKSYKQEQELTRLSKELDKTNRTWELKLSIMQKNFHALKDESYLRHRFQRQSSLLHYATVGYAAGNPGDPHPPTHQPRQLRGMRASQGQRGSGEGTEGGGIPEEFLLGGLPVPTPTPVHSSGFPEGPLDGGERSRSVHFEGGGPGRESFPQQVVGRKRDSTTSQPIQTQA